MESSLEMALTGCLLGTMAGDAVGLAFEGISPSRQQRLFGEITGPGIFWGKGIISDDTEHACIVAQSLLIAGQNPQIFERALAGYLRTWLLTIPPGIGWATLRAILKSWIGYSPENCGVFSAGNGPAMRSGILGACFRDDEELLLKMVKSSTRLTHTDPKAEIGAIAIALASAMGSSSPQSDVKFPDFFERLKKLVVSFQAEEFLELMKSVGTSLDKGQDSFKFATSMGLGKGISRYMFHTVPMVLHTWFRNQDSFRKGILEIVKCGGDTDTTGAILGSIIGSRVGKHKIPSEWLESIIEWPRTTIWIESLGKNLAANLEGGTPSKPFDLFFPKFLLRNLFCIPLILFHGFRRLLPPY